MKQETRKDMEQLISRSFLARVPEIMARGGFTLQTAIEQAYREDEAFCLEMLEDRTERARRAISTMSLYTYQRIKVAH